MALDLTLQSKTFGMSKSICSYLTNNLKTILHWTCRCTVSSTARVLEEGVEATIAKVAVVLTVEARSPTRGRAVDPRAGARSAPPITRDKQASKGV